MRGRSLFKIFLRSFSITLLLLLFVFAMLLVDAEGRRLSFNDTSPPFAVRHHADGTAELEINAFSLHRAVDFTGPVRVWNFVADFLCLPRYRAPRTA